MTVFLIAVGFLSAFLSGMGIGNAGLFVVFLTFFCGEPQLTAQGVNLLFFLFSAGAAGALYVRRGAFSPLLVALIVAGGIPGSFLGALAAGVLPEIWLRRIFGVFLTVAGARGVFRALFPPKAPGGKF